MTRKRRLKPYLAESFANSKNQVINPGDNILIVTMCTSRVNVNLGRYLGKRESGSWRDQKHYQAVVEVDQIRKKTVLKTDETVVWTYDYTKLPGLVLPPELPYPQYPSCRSYNRTPEEVKAMEEYHAANNARQARYSERFKLINEYREQFYKEIEIPYVRTVTLQRNRIYPLSSGLDILKGGL